MKKVLITAVILSVVMFSVYLNLEPTPMFAASDSKGQVAQLTVASEIALGSCTGTTVMSPGITMSYDSSTGTTTCTVDTTNVLGYKVDIYASSSPALKSGNNYFSNISTSTTQIWANATSTNIFGFSLVGTDVDTGIWGAPSTPNMCAQPGPNDPVTNNLKYKAFDTSATTTITKNSSTAGPNTFYICLVAEQGNATNSPSGVYFATTTVTATTL
jgi:hypothetical protein